MKNRILKRLGAQRLDAVWLFTLLSVLEVGRYTLEEWNEVLSLVAGHRVCCPSYRSLERYLHQMLFDVE